MKIRKMFCSINHRWDMKWTEFKATIITYNRVELIKFISHSTILKHIYLTMDIVGYHIFINLLAYFAHNFFTLSKKIFRFNKRSFPGKLKRKKAKRYYKVNNEKLQKKARVLQKSFWRWEDWK